MGRADPDAGPAVREPARPTLRNVQGLRAVAALTVVVAHLCAPDGFQDHAFGSRWASWADAPGTAGVDLFFVISGLIMTVTTHRSLGSPGAAGSFLLRRVVRIYPLYWAVTTPILVVSLVAPSLVSWGSPSAGDVVASYLLLPQDGRKILLVGWTLVYEMYFYLLFAVAIRCGRRAFPWLVGAWCLTTVVLHVTVGPTSNPYLALASSLLSVEFVMGVAVGGLFLSGRLHRPGTVLAVGVVAAVALLAGVAASGGTAFPSEAFRVAGPGVAMALVVYGAVGLEARRGAVVPAFLQRWGDASYSLYLIHVPVLTAAAAVIAATLPSWTVVHALSLVVAPAVLVVLSRWCYLLVERPLQDLCRRLLLARPGRSRPEAAVTTSS